MKLVIDIPESDYKFIKDLQSLIIGGRGSCKIIQYNVINAIKNGTPYEELEPSSCELMEFGKCSYKETGCSDCYIKTRIRRALDEKCYEIGHADGARLGYEKGLKEASNYSEGWMDGYNQAIDQIFKELNSLLKNHVIEELRKRNKR